MRVGIYVSLSILFLLIWAGCNPSSDGPLFILLEPELSGVSFNNQLTESDSANIIEYLYFYNGGGLATGDINNDGLPDLMFGGNQVSSKLYLNTTSGGTPEFQDITSAAGLDLSGTWTTGINMADVNGDRLLDIYVCQVNYKNLKGRNRLYINQGLKDGIPFFIDQIDEYGLAFEGLSTQSAFFDYDLDGDLDMYLLNHSVHSAENYAKSDAREVADPNGDRLYRNDNGVYIEVTAKAGIYNSKIGFGLGIGIGDLNNDSYPDIYIGNDFHENDYVFLNNTDGTFTDVAARSLGHSSQFSMGLDIADINNDGHLDVLTMDMMPEDPVIKKSSVPSDNYNIYLFKHNFGYHYQLPRNNLQLYAGQDTAGIPSYSEIGQLLEIEDTDWSWSGLLADYNNDGLKDLYVTNGIVRRPNDLDYLNYIADPLVQNSATDQEIAAQMPDGGMANYLFKNKGNLQFEDVSTDIDNNASNISTSAVYLDIDADGDLDIVTNNINDPATILINQTNTSNSLTIELIGDEKNTFGIGAKIITTVGSNKYYMENNPVRGFMSSSLGNIVIGVGDTKIIDQVEIIWPSGKYQSFDNIVPGTIVEAKEESANGSYISPGRSLNSEVSMPQALIEYIHKENDYIDANADKLMPWLLSTQGPAMAVGDINGDGLDDVFIGGARGQEAVFYSQEEAGVFNIVPQDFLSKDAIYEDVDALLVDVDGDKDLDLYVVSGGNEQLMDSPFLLDRIYVNDGTGSFRRNTSALPLITENGSSVSAADYDNDGDQDLLLGIVTTTNTYGLSSGAYLLRNDGAGKYQDITKHVAPSLKDIGMVTDITWGDIDSDGDQDIVVVGEWMPIVKMINTGGRFELEMIPNTVGLWRSVELRDINNDDKLDILAGNFGTNTFLAQDEGAGLAIGDMDGNRVYDPLLYIQKDGVRHPVAGKDLLTNQMTFFKSLHKDYASFAKASFDEMFAPVIAKIIKNTKLQELESTVLINKSKGVFGKLDLPRELQFAPIYAWSTIDRDGVWDEVIAAGNFYEVSPYIGRADASYGVRMTANSEGTYKISGPIASDQLITGQVRKMSNITINGEDYVLIAKNNGPLQLLRHTVAQEM